MHEAVEVVSSARLHLGFLDLSFTRGRRFGSVGMALHAPETRLVLARSRETVVRGEDAARAQRHLETVAAHLGLKGSHALTIASAIPAHSGLGSGTQLALSVASALRRLHGLPANPGQDARVLGRGRRSGIGIFLFQQGGLVVDGGHRNDELPPLLARMTVPEDWRVLLIQDPAHRGLSGARESEAFAGLPPLADRLTERICRLVLMQALPAVAEDDLPSFGAAVTEMQRIAGDYFAPAQGGQFTSPAIAEALGHASEAGTTGIGQSSWGPSGFAFIRGEPKAQRAARILRERVPGLDIQVCAALNHGARMTKRPTAA
ncbi:MAG: GHMP kinase [Acetobacteraceae bacterium]|nr:GHMP kinase [Acetobacteraceae bacterium]